MFAERIYQMVELGNAWISLLLLAAWRVLPILVLAIGIGFAFRRKLDPTIHALLWTIVVIRFLLPISLGSPTSFHGPIDALFSTKLEEQNGAEITWSAPENNLTASYDVSANTTDQPSLFGQPVPVPAQRITWEEVTLIAVSLTAILVTLGFVFRTVSSHIRFALRLRSCRTLDDPELVDMLLRECDSLGVGRRPVIREVPSLTAPAVFGLVRQTICFPCGFRKTINVQELRWVLRHELAHIRRRDIPVMVVASLATACHWFNPLVWLTVSRLRSAIEAAADRLAIANLSNSEAASYGHLLLRLAEHENASRSSPTLGLLTFASGRHLKKRVELLMHRSATGLLSKSFAVVVVAIVAATGLTDAREVVQQGESEVNLLKKYLSEGLVAGDAQDPWKARENEGPAYLKVYDIDSILKTMRLPQAIADNKDVKSQLIVWLPFLHKADDYIQVDGRTLIAKLNARQHHELAQSLEIWKNGEPNQVYIETRFIQTNVKLASEIDWLNTRIAGIDVQGAGPAIAARITEQQIEALVSEATKDSRTNVLFAPKVTCYDGQTATIADQVKRPFVTGVEPRADGSLEPVVTVLDEGLKVVLTPRTEGDNAINFDFTVSASKIEKVSYANLPLRNSGQDSPHVTVEVPATERSNISARVKLNAGESVVVAIPKVFAIEQGAVSTESSSNADKMTLVLLTPRIISVAELNAPAVGR
jgi:beta-lactamase regulating signal transducer with metallopeptidase domain